LNGPSAIVLVGLPGAGKSTVGPILAQRLGWRFVDLDEQIEIATGLPVTEIFERRGEEAFRRLETTLTEQVASEPELVLSVGGGWIVRNKLPGALVVWLQVDPDVASVRACEGASVRPLLQPNPQQRMQELFAERKHLYEQADIHIDTNGMTPDAVAVAVAVAVGEHGN
jgi:shikimate kinase